MLSGKTHFTTALLCWIYLLIAGVPAQQITAQDDMPVAVVAALKMNVLYLGIDNPLKIAVSENKLSELDVSISNGTLTGKNGRYIAKPETAGQAIIRVSIHGSVVSSCEFRVKTLPTPVAMVCGQKSGVITKEKLLKMDKVEAVIENFAFDAPCKVISFKISMRIPSPGKEGKAAKDPVSYSDVEIVSNSEMLSPEQKALIEKAAPEQKIYIEDIKASCPDGTVRDLESLILLVHQ